MKPRTVTTTNSTISTVSATLFTPVPVASGIMAGLLRRPGSHSSAGGPGRPPARGRAGGGRGPVGGPGQRRGEEDPRELVPEEERDGAESRSLPGVAADPH